MCVSTFSESNLRKVIKSTSYRNSMYICKQCKYDKCIYYVDLEYYYIYATNDKVILQMTEQKRC